MVSQRGATFVAFRSQSSIAPLLSTKFYHYQRRLFRRLFPVRVPDAHRTHIGHEKIGNDYGFIAVPKGVLHAQSIVYSVGAGLDILTDVALVRAYGCPVYIIDPTPRAIAHFQQLQEAVAKGAPFGNESGEIYHATPEILAKLRYEPVAIWDKDETVQFFEPADPTNVSHSITNAQASGRAINVPALTVASLMQKLGHDRVDYLKLDIEGAEYRVVDELVLSRTLPKVLYLEYHFDQNIPPYRNLRQIEASLHALCALGYRVFYAYDQRCYGLLLAE